MPLRIESPADESLNDLCRRLEDLAPTLDASGAWPGEQLKLCGEAGVFEWFLPREHGGLGWSDEEVVRGYLRLSAACLTTTFVITQRTGACTRIAYSENEWPRREFLPALLAGDIFATVGISHLTTSRRHLKRPVLRAEETSDGFRLDGYSPWVTGGPAADLVVVGATLDDGRQILAAVPTGLAGVSIPDPVRLVGLDASQTGPIQFDDVHVEPRFILAGPIENVMRTGVGANTGGLQTTTLALGLADAAIRFVERESDPRRELFEPAEALREHWEHLRNDLLAAAAGSAACSTDELRRRANSLALRAAQASLAAAKGAGYVVGHPAGRWCREALFFLVWSCPQPVLEANLCELAGLTES